MDKKYCVHCGKELKKAAKFCGKCGMECADVGVTGNVDTLSEEERPQQKAVSLPYEETQPQQHTADQQSLPLTEEQQASQPYSQQLLQKATATKKRQLRDAVEKFNQGQVSAFDDIYKLAYRDVFIGAKVLMKNEQDAEDVTQEVFIQAYAKLESLESPDAAAAWFRTVTRNTCLNRLRKHGEVLLGEDEEYIMDNQMEHDESALPETAYITKERNAVIMEMVEELPLEQREAVLYYYIHDQSVSKVAELCKVSAGTIKSRLNYARTKLRALAMEREKQGIKLYGFGPLPLLGYFLRNASNRFTLSPETAETILSNIYQSGAEIAATAAVEASASAIGTGIAAGATEVAGIGVSTSTVGTGIGTSSSTLGAGVGTSTGTAATSATAPVTGIGGLVSAAGTKICAAAVAAAILVTSTLVGVPIAGANNGNDITTTVFHFSAPVFGSHHFMAITDEGTLIALWEHERNRFSGQITDGSELLVDIDPQIIMEDVVAFSGGFSHNLAITSDGTLWAWGLNENGQLGDGTTIDRNYPIQIMENVKAISAGGEHSMAITHDGNLWVWGSNRFGMVGDGTLIDRLIPVKIMDNVVAISAGSSHSLAVTYDGSLWAWGWNGSGRLGDGTFTERHTPVKVMTNVKDVSAGREHSMAIMQDGSLWVWGSNYHGELGYLDMLDELFYLHGFGSGFSIMWTAIPVRIMDNVVAISAGGYHSMAITTDGNLWGWGHNFYAQLGVGTPDLADTRNTPVMIMEGVKAISAGNINSMAITTDGSLWLWGVWIPS